MINDPSFIAFTRFSRTNGQYVYGVRGSGLKLHNLLRDLYGKHILFETSEHPWIFWTFYDGEDEANFIAAYSDEIFKSP